MNPYDIDPFLSQPGFERTSFTTTFNKQYIVTFTDRSIGAIKAHSFDFEIVGEEMNGSFPIDPRIPETLATILDSYFSRTGGIILYYPFDGDPCRLRLFDIWHQRYVSKMSVGKVTLRKFRFEYDENSMITFGVLHLDKHAEFIREIEKGDLSELWDFKS